MLITPAYAQTAGAAAQPGGVGGLIQFAMPFVLVLVAFYFIMYLPQQRRAKAFRATVDALKKGDQVITAGGILGKVTRVEDQYVELEIAANTRVRVVKATLTEVIGNPAAKPAND